MTETVIDHEWLNCDPCWPVYLLEGGWWKAASDPWEISGAIMSAPEVDYFAVSGGYEAVGFEHEGYLFVARPNLFKTQEEARNAVRERNRSWRAPDRFA